MDQKAEVEVGLNDIRAQLISQLGRKPTNPELTQHIAALTKEYEEKAEKRAERRRQKKEEKNKRRRTESSAAGVNLRRRREPGKGHDVKERVRKGGMEAVLGVEEGEEAEDQENREESKTYQVLATVDGEVPLEHSHGVSKRTKWWSYILFLGYIILSLVAAMVWSPPPLASVPDTLDQIIGSSQQYANALAPLVGTQPPLMQHQSTYCNALEAACQLYPDPPRQPFFRDAVAAWEAQGTVRYCPRPACEKQQVHTSTTQWRKEVADSVVAIAQKLREAIEQTDGVVRAHSTLCRERLLTFDSSISSSS